MIPVQELSTAHQALGKKITRCVYRKESSILTILLFQSTKMESLLKNVLHMKIFMWKMLIKSLSKTSSRKEGWSKAVHKCITILTVGEVILPSFTRRFHRGSSKSQILRRTWLKITIRLIGCQNQSNKSGLTTGWRMPKIGVFRETDIGGIRFHCGFRMMGRRLFVLDQWKSCKNWRVRKSRIYTDNTSITWPFSLAKVKEN